MSGTKKVGITGRFGPRYGIKVRRKIRNIESKLKNKHACPSCSKQTLKRTALGIWMCKNCGLKTTGNAYTPQIKK